MTMVMMLSILKVTGETPEVCSDGSNGSKDSNGSNVPQDVVKIIIERINGLSENLKSCLADIPP